MTELKQLDNVKILWHLGYWDGPQSGVAVFNNDLVYFDLMEQAEPKLVTVEEDGEEFEDAEWGWYRKFKVYELNHDDKIRLITTHALWQGHMGLHTDYFPWNARKARHDGFSYKEERKVPVLHYGPSAASDTAWNDYQILMNKWEKRYGSFEAANAKPIGWVEYDDLIKV